jgi:Cell Wall Hydrolase
MAQPGAVGSSDGGDRQRAITCLAYTIAYEAGYEPLAGQQSVAEVVINRLRDPTYPKSVCGVVFAGSERKTGCQFSFTCDGSMGRRLSVAVMNAARIVAESALDGRNPLHVAGATHYHADYVSPYWAPSLSRVATIGRHIFYRPPGARDQGVMAMPVTAFAEPPINKLKDASLDPSVANRPSDRLVRAAAPPEPQVFAPWGLSIAGPGNR